MLLGAHYTTEGAYFLTDTIIVDQGASIRDSESRAMELKRDQIAEKMWLDYQGYINNNTNK